MSGIVTRSLAQRPDTVAPDGAQVYLLAADAGASMAQFVLAPGQVSAAVVHATVAEYWYVIAGRGRIWRHFHGHPSETGLVPGVSLTIPVGTEFQFRNDGADDLRILGFTTPPWPGAAEAVSVPVHWSPSDA